MKKIIEEKQISGAIQILANIGGVGGGIIYGFWEVHTLDDNGVYSSYIEKRFIKHLPHFSGSPNTMLDMASIAFVANNHLLTVLDG